MFLKQEFFIVHSPYFPHPPLQVDLFCKNWFETGYIHLSRMKLTSEKFLFLNNIYEFMGGLFSSFCLSFAI